MQLQSDLMRLEMYNALKALKCMVKVMNAENGYKRTDGSNYYYHLVDATQDLINFGIKDEVTITACLLHDYVEDVEGVSIQVVADEYGQEVAQVVDMVTKKNGIDYKDADGININNYLSTILLSPRACLVKTADRKHNFSTLDSTSAKHEARQVAETEKHFIPFFKEARKRYPEYSAYFHSAKTTIVPHLKRIKKAIAEEGKLKDRIVELELKLEQERKHIKALEKKNRRLESENKTLKGGHANGRVG